MPLIDANGIEWLCATGQQGVTSQSRNESNDKRWSGNVSDVSTYGYEVTSIFTFSGVTNNDGHFALKHFGPNHSGDCGYEESGDCCCWYDTGIRDNGDVQLQTERPHPSNHDFSLTEDPVNGPLYMDNIGIPMEGNDIGLKWIVFPVVAGGSADNGGIRLIMYVDTNPLTAGVPNNNWVKVYDFIDNGQVLGDYEAPDEHDIENRVSDTDSVTAFAGGQHWRKLQAGDKEAFGTGATPEPPTGIIGGVNIQSAMNFIRNSYKSSVQMLEEAPSFNVFWLWNDQLLGQIILKHLDPVMATTIENKMNSFGVTMKTPWATLDPQYRANFSVKTPSEPTIQAGPPTIRYSDYNGGSDLSINDYADIAFLSAIHHFYNNNLTLARTAYDAGRAFWDGEGMDDLGNITGDYAVYKVALGMLAEKITNFTPSIGIPANYFAPFQASNGGITTDKTGGVPDGSQNIETTAAVLLALKPSLLNGPSTPPPPATPPPLYRFLSWGDNDTTSDAEAVLDQMFTETNVSRYLFAGDGPYDTDASAWITMMSSYFNTAELKDTKLILTQGNHEHPESESQEAEDDIEAWKSGLHNSVEGLEWLSSHVVGNVYILVLNSQDPNIDEVGGDQYNYVVTKLTEAMAMRAAGTIDWIITMVHKSWFNLLGSNPAYVTAREAYRQIFRQAQVDFMFHGHNHAYMIWKPIVAIEGNDENTASQEVFSLTPDGRYDFSKDHGAIYIVNGNGGHEINNWGEDPNDFPNVLFTYEDFGYSVLDIQGKQATLKAKDVNGNTLHTVEVTRGEDESEPPTPCPSGQHLDPVTGLCVPDTGGGGGTNPDPPTAETIYNDLVLIYNINSDSDGCICNAAPFTPPPPDPEDPPEEPPPDPDGGTNPNAIYDISYKGSGSDSVRIGKDSGDEHQYLQIGIVIKDADLADEMVGKAPKRAEVPLKRRGRFKDSSEFSVVVRSADNTIQTVLGTMKINDVSSDSTQYYAFENLSATYQLQEGDMILVESDRGDSDDYLIGYTKPANQTNGIKVIKRDNTMSEGDYRERDQEFAFRIFA